LAPGDLDTLDDVSQFKDKYGAMGTLLVKLWQVEIGLERPTTRVVEATEEELEIPEKALKGRPLDVAAR
jgi:hypothetical protein